MGTPSLFLTHLLKIKTLSHDKELSSSRFEEHQK